MVEQILSSHPKVYGAEEVEFVPYLIKKNFGDKDLRLFFEEIVNFDKTNLRKIGDEYIDKMRYVSNNSDRTTDKLPINFSQLVSTLPRLRLIIRWFPSLIIS